MELNPNTSYNLTLTEKQIWVLGTMINQFDEEIENTFVWEDDEEYFSYLDMKNTLQKFGFLDGKK